ncbi:hypothetical protein MIMI-R681 [Acanthamoeba polyphaga mimivirus]|uniref:Uncharacterized protein n=1 Tax=Acanthamoeba polyphaga mimivirus TaxID=212035 RepID=E5L7Z2_MIMIV|nr:hypothetical protein MIMI_gp0856 [Acanthamoeba polyphaga mimivirus]ADQ48144.1 hypothetical protein [Acanthamoeba polyphaga mimivirus]UTE96772.1 hypothetical protein MIMI-R681 [Acanthamoeba polyphaga mimivirus]
MKKKMLISSLNQLILIRNTMKLYSDVIDNVIYLLQLVRYMYDCNSVKKQNLDNFFA